MNKDFKNSLQALRTALSPLNVSDFIRHPAEYIALYTPICVPPMASRPGHGNLPKPFFSITYGECRALHATLDEIEKVMGQKSRGGEAARTLAELTEKLTDQLQEIKVYGDYMASHPKYKDEDRAYHLSTFINDFTNSTSSRKSPYPEFSGTKRHTMTVANLKAVVAALRSIEASVHSSGNFMPSETAVAELQPAL